MYEIIVVDIIMTNTRKTSHPQKNQKSSPKSSRVLGLRLRRSTDTQAMNQLTESQTPIDLSEEWRELGYTCLQVQEGNF